MASGGHEVEASVPSLLPVFWFPFSHPKAMHPNITAHVSLWWVKLPSRPHLMFPTSQHVAEGNAQEIVRNWVQRSQASKLSGNPKSYNTQQLQKPICPAHTPRQWNMTRRRRTQYLPLWPPLLCLLFQTTWGLPSGTFFPSCRCSVWISPCLPTERTTDSCRTVKDNKRALGSHSKMSSHRLLSDSSLAWLLGEHSLLIHPLNCFKWGFLFC